jgi:predicted Fe-Mo cluster-binding NifX family protein
LKTIVLAANDDQGLDGEMGQHFGRCPFYVLVHVNGSYQVKSTQIKANPYVEQHVPGQVPEFIHSLGADVVIAPGMGHKAITWFEGLGVEVATGSRGRIGATLQAYLDGEIKGASGCSHHHSKP